MTREIDPGDVGALVNSAAQKIRTSQYTVGVLVLILLGAMYLGGRAFINRWDKLNTQVVAHMAEEARIRAEQRETSIHYEQIAAVTQDMQTSQKAIAETLTKLGQEMVFVGQRLEDVREDIKELEKEQARFREWRYRWDVPPSADRKVP